MNDVNHKVASISIADPQYGAELSVVATRLVEAVRFARDGNGEAAKAQIARAMALLHGEPGSVPANLRPLGGSTAEISRGGLPAWKKRRLIAYVDAHLADAIRTEDLAQLLNLSGSHFNRAFRVSFGTSAHDYVTRRRIEMTQGLMLSTSDALCMIAVSCGFSDQSHFTRVFRRVVGETPAVWRRMRSGEFEDRMDESRTNDSPPVSFPASRIAAHC